MEAAIASPAEVSLGIVGFYGFRFRAFLGFRVQGLGF